MRRGGRSSGQKATKSTNWRKASAARLLLQFIEEHAEEPEALDAVGTLRSWLDSIEDDLVLKSTRRGLVVAAHRRRARSVEASRVGELPRS